MKRDARIVSMMIGSDDSNRIAATFCLCAKRAVERTWNSVFIIGIYVHVKCALCSEIALGVRLVAIFDYRLYAVFVFHMHLSIIFDYVASSPVKC